MQTACVQTDVALDHEYAVVYTRLCQKYVHSFYSWSVNVKSVSTIFSATYELGVKNFKFVLFQIRLFTFVSQVLIHN